MTSSNPNRLAPIAGPLSVPNCHIVDLLSRGDERGQLVAIEGGRDTPFDIKRAYYVFATQPGVARGFHAHRRLTQLAVCVSGSCRMLLDDGATVQHVNLDRPDKGLLIGPMVWREMHQFSEDAVLLVLADDHYDEGEYIRSFEEFQALAEAKRMKRPPSPVGTRVAPSK